MVSTVVEHGRSDGKLDAVQLSRRTALGLALLAVAGCQSRTKETPLPPAAAPDHAALQSAREGEQALLAAYDTRIRSVPLHKRGALQVERAIHATHLAALHGTAAHHATPAPVTTPLDAALRASARTLRRLALHATEGANAALLASIAASHTASAGGAR
jgi:hypothetical protein